jgi:capsule polysaccharide export protein KpsE/RkpR
MIDHPRQIGWDLDTDADVESETGAEARLRVRLEPGGGARVTVTESVVSGEELYLADADLDTLVAWSSTSALDPGVRAAFARIAGLRRALADTETALADAEAAIVWLTAEQDRVRGNLGAVPQTSDLAKTYLARMATLDEAIMEANAAREAAIDARAGARRAFEAGIASFGG